jgi:YVTN family beta-propeller protein
MNSEKKPIRMHSMTLSMVTLILGACLLAACDDMTDKVPESGAIPYDENQSRLYILSEGLFHNNNSTLAMYDFETHSTAINWFEVINQRKLGDTANDMAIYGNKLYVVVSQSGLVEIIDKQSGRSLKQLHLHKEHEEPRQPRSIAFLDGFAYVCSFDGTVVEIDTTTLSITRITTAGSNPDAITIANNKIYVSNSGGLNITNYDSTVSVIDPVMFREIKKIKVGTNPSTLIANSKGDLYVATRGNYGNEHYQLHLIDTHNDQYIKAIEGVFPLNFTMHNDTLWMYSYDFKTGESSFQRYDSSRQEHIAGSFITDNTPIQTPYGIAVHPITGDIFITDARSFTIRGDVYCFSANGKLKYRLPAVGVNPTKILID